MSNRQVTVARSADKTISIKAQQQQQQHSSSSIGWLLLSTSTMSDLSLRRSDRKRTPKKHFEESDSSSSDSDPSPSPTSSSISRRKARARAKEKQPSPNNKKRRLSSQQSTSNPALPSIFRGEFYAVRKGNGCEGCIFLKWDQAKPHVIGQNAEFSVFEKMEDGKYVNLAEWSLGLAERNCNSVLYYVYVYYCYCTANCCSICPDSFCTRVLCTSLKNKTNGFFFFSYRCYIHFTPYSLTQPFSTYKLLRNIRLGTT